MNKNKSDFESPLEEELFEKLRKFKNDEVIIETQKKINTIGSAFYIDFVLLLSYYKVAIECDGKEFHEGEELEIYDEWRDALILETKDVDLIFRFRGKDIYSLTDEIIYVLAREIPDFFNSINIHNYPTLFRKHFHEHRKIGDRNTIYFLGEERDRQLRYYKRDLNENQSYYASRGLLMASMFPEETHKNISCKEFRSKNLDIGSIIKHLSVYNHKLLLRITPYIKFHDLNFNEELIEIIKNNRSFLNLSNQTFRHPLSDITPLNNLSSREEFLENCKIEWCKLIKNITGEYIPSSIVWRDRKDIFAILTKIVNLYPRVICQLPNQGTVEISKVREAYESLFLELNNNSGGTPTLINPLSLELIIPNELVCGYFVLHSQNVKKVELSENRREYKMQFLAEIQPGIYDNQEEINNPDNIAGARVVRRIYSDALKFYAKGMLKD